ncbi:hypothetical protein MAPG_00333 [Magnaporthiopsis poae ATCC 64411]|uniref:Hsp90 chaperone protein kinase-targeting subunit n=1 Tax=Magnaporthiopsis poae (strain ATCC 64411 / 73-15) TaxID=644358 RepID=A0A0C4DKQ5_MAGP6|nr:hypothetical protein MAPG_00333 [Magnaporthiopsis poae ATCC 64411]
MPLDYSKWDALELSDDSDIEVHPNVDKRSFIRAKQNQIHMERARRKNEIETLKYERIAWRCVHQALLLQYCRALGRDGVQLFFKRITTANHQAQEVFLKDVRETYGKIKVRTAEINKQRAAEKAEGGGVGVEQIQLHAVEPGTKLSFRVPDKDSQDPQEQAAWAIFESFTPEMKKAIQSGNLDEVNKVLGELNVAEAEELVGKFNEAGILNLEEGVIDTTTEEGKAEFEKRKEMGSKFADDPE